MRTLISTARAAALPLLMITILALVYAGAWSYAHYPQRTMLPTAADVWRAMMED